MAKKQEKSEAVSAEEFEKLQGELNSLQTLADQLENQLKRAVADYHNLEKRVAEGRSELTKWGTSELLIKLLPTLDHLEQALAGANQRIYASFAIRGFGSDCSRSRDFARDRLPI